MEPRVTIAEVERVLGEAGIGGRLLNWVTEKLRTASEGDGQPSIVAKVLPDLVAVARRFHRDSLKRTEVVGHQVDDPSWNMLLALFADTVEDRAVSISSAVWASGVPPTTALRYIERLGQDGLITRRPDPSDKRRAYISPTPQTMDRMDAMIRRFCVALPSDEGPAPKD